MKSIAFLFLPLLISTTGFCQHKKDSTLKKGPAIEWVKGRDFDFGKIPSDKIATTTFEFINTGTAKLKITGASTSCHCYVADYPLEPIAPGDSGYVRISYDPEHQTGMFYKTTLIFTNVSKERLELNIKGEVVR